MKSRRFVGLAVGVLVVAVMQEAGFGQVNQGVPTAAAQYFARRNSTNQVAYNPGVPQPTGSYLPPPQPVQVAGTKPFQDIQHQPTLTPYLGLDVIPETGTSLPNYHVFVRPQIQQRAANEAQGRELKRLRQQMRVATAQGIVSKNPSGGVPTTGGSLQFMNTGSYFPAVQ